MKRPLITRPGYRSTFHKDDGKITIVSQEDCAQALEHVKHIKPLDGEEFTYIGYVPRVVCQKAREENWDDTDWAKWLNDPDHSKLRPDSRKVSAHDLRLP